jgi:hypothetical protein
MKATVKQLRGLISEAIMTKPLGQPEGIWLDDDVVLREEFLHGVPEWQLREDTSNFVDVIRKRCTAFILLNKSENGADQREAIAAMNDVCDTLEDKVYDVLEGELFNFSRRV